jgi:hypothetical protein
MFPCDLNCCQGRAEKLDIRGAAGAIKGDEECKRSAEDSPRSTPPLRELVCGEVRKTNESI